MSLISIILIRNSFVILFRSSKFLQNLYRIQKPIYFVLNSEKSEKPHIFPPLSMSRAKKQNLESYSAEQTHEEAFEKQRVSVSNARETSFRI